MAHAVAVVAPVPELLWIPALPLAAFIILILVGHRLGRLSALVAVGSLAGACGAVLSMA